jgi:heterodisulfide reductase subunit A-like polyferredoxin
MDTVVVVGGGITGMQASLDLSRLGCKVTLVEREGELGGKLRFLHSLFPGGESAAELLTATRAHLEREHVTVVTGREIAQATAGQNGYRIELSGNGNALEARAVVLATGFDAFDPAVIEEYGYGRFKDVVTAFDLEAMMKDNRLVRPSQDAAPRSISFLQCVGSRDRRTNRYCSYFCCTYAIKEALALKKRNPAAEISILYMDIRTPYLYEHLYTEAREQGIRFIRSRVSGVYEAEGCMNLDLENTLTGESETLTSDLVVLAIGGVPAAGTGELAAQFQLPLTDHGFFKIEEPPVTTAAAGVFVAGAASGMKDIPLCRAEASASALEACTFMDEKKR